MRDSFFGYYRPTSEEYEILWKNALIVFDANALLNFYRVPPKGREALFSTLEYFVERLWIPHQAGLEFHRNRFDVVRRQKKLTTDALSKTRALIQDLQSAVSEIKIEQHDIDIDPSSALKKLEVPLEEISSAIRKVQETEINLISSDPVRDRLDAILEGKIGPAPKTQQELDDLCRDVAHRYQSKIPPGWKDAETKKDQSFHSDHLHYHNANGDLIFWRQLIAHLKTNEIKHVILVTNENKEDWWWKESGEIVGPLSELMREIRREAGVELFWMYKTDQFLKTSQDYTSENVEVTAEAVAEVRQVVERENSETKASEAYERHLDHYLRTGADEQRSINERMWRILSAKSNDWKEKSVRASLSDFMGRAVKEANRSDKSIDRVFGRLEFTDINIINQADAWLTANRGEVVDRTSNGDFTVLIGEELCRYRFDHVGSIEHGIDFISAVRAEVVRAEDAGRPPASRFLFAIPSETLTKLNFPDVTIMLGAISKSYELEEVVLTVITDKGLRTFWNV
ncbi:PIN-like domain-containing protein [Agrobacterium tumefaciens]|uniref:PIN-like domain-containing protein n=1 Tax=Agrobacterium tumefaciens TaxID=358 RepID=UPI0021D3297C|nr:PIN-like domain-containing protein [Agrobacterium tumefaciens]UXT96782.1 DUF4935 domain-containing protein [Agrobacterium tumefaciens]